jgi:hypothetical protein
MVEEGIDFENAVAQYQAFGENALFQLVQWKSL